jgi:hypothetical protein
LNKLSHYTNYISTRNGFLFAAFVVAFKKFVGDSSTPLHLPLAPIEFIIHIQLGHFLGLARELLIHVQTIDCLSQCDVILLKARSVQQDHLPTSSLRAELHSLIGMFQLKSPTELQVLHLSDPRT